MKLILSLCLILVVVGCSKGKDDVGGPEMTEPAQQIGDLMASVDEMGGTSGSISLEKNLEKSAQKTFARYSPQELNKSMVTRVIVPAAQARSCSSTDGGFNGGFGNCSGVSTASNSRTRTFAGCTVGATEEVIFNGTVVFTWDNASGGNLSGCGLNSTGNTITRSPTFTVEGRRGATLTVSKNGTYGQRLTWQSGASPKTFLMTSDGIRRKYTTAGGVDVFDYVTTITSAVTVTNELRNGRVLNGGTIQVRDNLTQVTCDYTPTNVTWAVASCNCPSQGTWQATCSDGKTASLVLNGCGTGAFTMGSESGTVTFDRCGN